MKIFLTGASGMLAAEVVPKLIKDGHTVVQTDLRPRTPDINQLDISEFKEAKKQIIAAKPDFIFHLAAETDVDLCEEQPDHAYKVNTLGTENIALICQESDTPLLYISTAGVFPGDKKERASKRLVFPAPFSPVKTMI